MLLTILKTDAAMWESGNHQLVPSAPQQAHLSQFKVSHVCNYPPPPKKIIFFYFGGGVRGVEVSFSDQNKDLQTVFNYDIIW